MARPLRIEFAGALYHLTSRADRQEDIYASDKDPFVFLEILAQVVKSHISCLRKTNILGARQVPTFIGGLKKKIDEDHDLREIPKSQRRSKPDSLEYYVRPMQAAVIA